MFKFGSYLPKDACKPGQVQIPYYVYVEDPSPKFERLVLVRIDAIFCDQIFILHNFRDLQDLQTFAPLQIQDCSNQKIYTFKIVKFLMNDELIKFLYVLIEFCHFEANF